MSATEMEHRHVAELDCCPVLEDHECCDRLDFKYTLRHPVRPSGARQPVTVLVTCRSRRRRRPAATDAGDESSARGDSPLTGGAARHKTAP
jgi:hypothetical protein